MSARESNKPLTEQLQAAIEVEHTLSMCCNHLISLLRNGRVKNKFLVFSDSAKKNETVLMGRLKKLGTSDFIAKDKCPSCKVNPTNFSLVGAINLGLEIVSVAMRCYKHLANSSGDSQDKRLFKRLLKEKTQQRDFLKKEREFDHQDEFKLRFIEEYCISEIISRLWE